MLYASDSLRTTQRLATLHLGVPTYMRAPGESSGSFALESAMDELAHRGFALGRVLLPVKILRDNDLCGEQRPRLRNLDVFLLENHLAGVVGDLGGAAVPFDLIEWLDFRVTENAPDGHRLFSRGRLALEPVGVSRNRRRGTMLFMRRRSQNFFARVNHGFPFRGG